MADLSNPDVHRKVADSLQWREACGGWNPHYPHPKQQAFLLLNDYREVLFGGAAGGGKTDALLMAALQYVCVPGYASILFRQTGPQLTREGGLVDRAFDWLGGTAATYKSREMRWTFPSGATLSFGFVEREAERFRYQGPEFQFVGFDELTHWPTDRVYRYLFSRLRKPDHSPNLPACPDCGLTVADIPIRMRAGTNPGGPGGDWVYRRFVKPWRERDGLIRPNSRTRVFLPSKLKDNPSLNYDEYIESLGELDPMTLAQLLDGDWDVRESGGMFKRHYFKVVKDWPREARLCRFWDLASVEETGSNDPDWTAGVLMAELNGRYWVIDVKRLRGNPGQVEDLVKQTADLDRITYGHRIRIRMEQEPGSSGVKTIDDYRRRVLKGYDFQGRPPQSKKEHRAGPVASAAHAGNLELVEGAWNEAYIDELVMFPQDGYHDDQVDATSGALTELAGLGLPKRGGLRS